MLKVKPLVNTRVPPITWAITTQVIGVTATRYYYTRAHRIPNGTNGTVNYYWAITWAAHRWSRMRVATIPSSPSTKPGERCAMPAAQSPPNIHSPVNIRTVTINLLWYGSRHYDPELGRFISPDSIVPTSVQGVQAYDRYAYANNAPTRYTDPTGHMIDDGYVGNLSAVSTVRNMVNIVTMGSQSFPQSFWQCEGHHDPSHPRLKVRLHKGLFIPSFLLF